MTQTPTGQTHHDTVRQDISSWPVPGNDETIVVTLSGASGETIGMNWTLYGHAGRWIIVDAGIEFPDRETEPHIEAYLPDPAVLAPVRHLVDALVVTHAHEDHIGAIHRFWPDFLNCPIHATPYAQMVIANRLDEFSTTRLVRMANLNPGQPTSIGGFTVVPVRTTHSVPEPVSLLITTKAGTILHTGDWKRDPTPLLGKPIDEQILADAGSRGLLAVVGDSTGAMKTEASRSELDVRNGMRLALRAVTGRAIVCCFASNIARIGSIMDAAQESGRTLAIAGRSLITNTAIAGRLGYLDPGDLEIRTETVRHTDPRETALICTGGQGEPNAALARLARGDSRRLPPLSPGDTVIKSCRTVPGNEAAVERIEHALRHRGVRIVDADSTIGGNPIHVSGHPGQPELRWLYETTRPRHVIAVHGTDEHVKAHANFARSLGIASFFGTNGTVYRLSNKDGGRIIGKIPFRRAEIPSTDSLPRQENRWQSPERPKSGGHRRWNEPYPKSA